MRTYIAYWPNKTITVLTASDEVELFDTLDEEGDPEQAEIFILPTKFAVTTSIVDGAIEAGETQSEKDLKMFKFNGDIFERVYF